MGKMFHVVSYDNFCKYFKNKSIIDTNTIQREFNNEKKRAFETVMERIRSLKYPELPSRISSLFVFPDKNKDEAEEEWARVFSNGQYILLTLEMIDGSIKWFDYSIYTLQEINNDIAEQYWSSCSDSPKNIVSNSIEGQFQGTAKIVEIDSKMYSRESGITFMEKIPLPCTDSE